MYVDAVCSYIQEPLRQLVHLSLFYYYSTFLTTRLLPSDLLKVLSSLPPFVFLLFLLFLLLLVIMLIN